MPSGHKAPGTMLAAGFLLWASLLTGAWPAAPIQDHLLATPRVRLSFKGKKLPSCPLVTFSAHSTWACGSGVRGSLDQKMGQINSTVLDIGQEWEDRGIWERLEARLQKYSAHLNSRLSRKLNKGLGLGFSGSMCHVWPLGDGEVCRSFLLCICCH